MSSTKLILYGLELSPPVRAVLLTLKALNLDYDFVEIDTTTGQQLTAEYLKKNPQHTVPLLEDGEHFIWDSHVICAYLVRKYGKDDTLYPKDYYQRAVVDQRLHYENGVLFTTCLKQIVTPIFRENSTEIPKEKIDQIHEAYAMLELFLGEHLYMAGGKLTIADFSIVSTVSTFKMAFAAVDAVKYPKLTAWLERMNALPYYAEVNLKGARDFSERIKSKLPKHFDKLWQKAMADIKSGKH
ncbi:glutathione S-transferase 1-like [Teleopsis dalmanni]|uniref:glutathione S-transferase 1-like n=1 Tax=Teleopsis dalmanni TaxID=139649 RepID=UPI0018CD6DD3|nr:glutathione S-transferase 1-like [Teleopsis dalmanni]